ncbi:MAG: hypothetical protein ACRED9_11425 [Caulobacteraceae bacterium]
MVSPLGPTAVGATGLAARGSETFGAIISFGLCGGLDPTLEVGDLVIASEIVDPAGRRMAADPALAERLGAAFPSSKLAAIAGSDTFLADPTEKQSLASATGAAAVDAESHFAATEAARRGVPFTAVRAVSDSAARRLPRAALVGLDVQGRLRLSRVAVAIARRPWELPALVRTAFEAESAFAALRAAIPALRRALGAD